MIKHQINLSFAAFLIFFPPGANCDAYKRFYPETEIERFFLDKKYIPWGKKYKFYYPPIYTAPCDDDCDPLSPNELVFNTVDNGTDRRSYVTRKYKVRDGFPRNPYGRTGIAGRGSLQRWGPNHLIMVVIARGQTLSTVLIPNEKIRTFPAEFIKGPMTGALPPKLYHMIKKDLCKSYHEGTAEELIKKATEKSILHFKGYFPDERNTDNAWTELTILEIQDVNDEHFGNLKFDDPNGTLIWQKFGDGIVQKTIESLVERSKLTLEERAKRGLKGAMWTVKNQGITGFASIFSDLLSHSVTITGIAVTLRAMLGG